MQCGDAGAKLQLLSNAFACTTKNGNRSGREHVVQEQQHKCSIHSNRKSCERGRSLVVVAMEIAESFGRSTGSVVLKEFLLLLNCTLIC